MAFDLNRISIMIADDNEPMRKLLKQILNAFGVNGIRECNDGGEIFKLLKEYPADMIITDWVMEPLDGLKLTKMIRTSPESANPYVPIIILTGHTEMHRIEEARDAGAQNFWQNLFQPTPSINVSPRLLKSHEPSSGQKDIQVRTGGVIQTTLLEIWDAVKMIR
jgi:CheY-like chemotaxis protein